MKIKASLITSFLLFAALIGSPLVIQAQESTESASVSATPSASPDTMLSTDAVFTRPRQTAEIQRLRELYQNQVERYTNLEREYLINKAQYQKLNTLQSLEEAIKSTREVMLARTDVLITYFELVRVALDDTEGVELVEKQKNVDLMIGYITVLREHREKIVASADREDIAARVAEYAELSVPFEATAYKSLALIRIGDIQTVFDKSEIIYRDVLQYHKANPTTPLRQQERDRAYKEVDNAIENTRADLLEVRTDFASSEEMTRTRYNSRLVGSLNTTYSGTSQILAFLEELFVELT